MNLKKLIAVLAFTLTSAGAEMPLPELRIEPTGGGSIFYIHNAASQPLTAYVIELVDYPGSYYALWQDDAAGEPIAPGAVKRIQITNMTVGAVPDYVKMRAALYADGSSAGIPEKVEQLVERRRFTLETTHELIQRLEKAQAGGSPKGAAADLKSWADSFEPKGKSRRDSQGAVNQAAARSLILEAVSALDAHSLTEEISALRQQQQRLEASKPALAQAGRPVPATHQ